MKRLRQWVFNGLALLSLALLVKILVLWIQSYGSAVTAYSFGPGLAHEYMSLRGQWIYH